MKMIYVQWGIFTYTVKMETWINENELCIFKNFNLYNENENMYTRKLSRSPALATMKGKVDSEYEVVQVEG